MWPGADLDECSDGQEARFLSAAFDDKATSYKLFWFRALLEVLKRRWNSESCGPIPVRELLGEMLTAAWHPVCLFRLSLGTTDRLQTACERLRNLSGLAPADKARKVRAFIASNPEALDNLWHLVTYVPALFLTPLFATEMRGIAAGTDRVKRATQLAFERRGQPMAPLYWLDGKGKSLSLQIDKKWEQFLRKNIGLLDVFADHHLCDYLQARNPSAPGIIRKLTLPQSRQLALGRSFWNHVRDVMQQAGRPELFRDIYSGERLEAGFSIDHFLPWSFVAHDQLWNLAPVSANTNSRKGDSLPNVEIYLPKLVALHWHALDAIRETPNFHDDYLSSFKENVSTLIEGGETFLLARYKTLVIPQAQLAVNQGFEADWKFSFEG